MRSKWTILLALVSMGLCFSGCEKTSPSPERETEQAKLYYYAGVFAFNRMQEYYLWNQEIEGALANWDSADEPISKIKEIRYKDSEGYDIDRWTMLTDDVAAFYNNTAGIVKTYGFGYMATYYDKDHYSLVVSHTYAGSPAEEAGLKRGDLIDRLNGKLIPISEVNTIVKQALKQSESVTLTMHSGETIQLTAREMYEDPVLLSRIFDCGGKKVGYLHYASFTLDSYRKLIDISKTFRAAGVSELILDLRYNSGGFSIAEEFLASMLVPEAEVQAGSILSTNIYNNTMTERFAQEGTDTNTYLKTRFVFASGKKVYDFSTADANMGISKLYVIISNGTASASEALIGDLIPYLDVTLVGRQTHGKFCTGEIMFATDFFKEYAPLMGDGEAAEGMQYTENWGLYIMVSRFADKNGVTLCMPDGIQPDYPVRDNPTDGYALGNPNETMLAKTLSLCGYKSTAPTAGIARVSDKTIEPELIDLHGEGSGLRIKLPE